MLESIYFGDNAVQPRKTELEAAILDSPAFVLPSSPRTVPSRLTTIWFQVETDIINPEPEFWREEDVQTKWHSKEDLEMIQLRAKDLSIELRQSIRPQDTALTIAHQKTSLMLHSNLQALVKLSHSTPDQDLAKWCAFTDGRRGLESLASRYYRAMRHNDISATRRAVLQSVRLMQDPETIARLSRVVSRRARTFAHYLAVADAQQAAQYTTTTTTTTNENEKSTADRFIETRHSPARAQLPDVSASCKSTTTTTTRAFKKHQPQPAKALRQRPRARKRRQQVPRRPRLVRQPDGIRISYM